ncbi:MAG: enoyl-CoA hydratase/isomerase family protein [Hyphomicrobiaceae bacterium]
MSDATIYAHVADGVASVFINRPEKKNCLSLAMWRRLGEEFEGLGSRRDVRCIVLSGVGDCFCAGADIGEFAEARRDAASAHTYEAVTEKTVGIISQCPKPTIAAIRGIAMGGGCGIALACDVRVADRTARMGISAARLGLVYPGLEAMLLFNQVGLARAKQILFTGNHFDAQKSYELQLVDLLVDDLDKAVSDLVQSIIRNAPLSLKAMKFILNSAAHGTVERDAARIVELFDLAANSADAREGAAAFLARRAPIFTGE